MDPFMLACNHGHKDVVKLLLDHKDSNIELNARSNRGTTPLMIACLNGHNDVVQLLLDQSKIIELNARNDNGQSAFMIACH